MINMSNQRNVRKKARQKQQKNSNPTTNYSTSKKINLSAELFDMITKESEFLGLTKDEYCKLIFTSAQVLRETSLQEPITNSNVLKSVIGSPLLLSLVKSFATNFLSSSIQDLFTSMQNPDQQSSKLSPDTSPLGMMQQSPALPRQPSPYPPASYWNGF